MIRRWLPIISLVASTIAVAVALLVFVRLSDNDSQFCVLNAQRLVDKQHQIAQTREYLVSPAGRKRSGLNVFIRSTSQPRLRAEVKSDQATLPSSCRDEYVRLRKH